MTANDTLLDAGDLIRILRADCAAAGGQKPWAETHGIRPQQLNDVLTGRRPPCNAILGALGLGRVTRYRHRKSA